MTSALCGGLVLAFCLAVVTRAQDDGARLARLNSTEVALGVRQGDNLNRLSRLLTALIQFRSDPPPALLVSPESATRAVRAAILVKAITPQLQARARTYALEAKEIARQRRLAAAASAATFSAESDLADEVKMSAALAAPTVELIAPAELRAPVSGPVLHRFGEALVGGGKANGLTYLASTKMTVAAPQAGLIQYAGPVKGWGVILILRLAGGYHLVLAGLDRTTVAQGQSVAAGAPVGVVAATGPRAVYFEVRAGDDPVDPDRWLRPAFVKPKM